MGGFYSRNLVCKKIKEEEVDNSETLEDSDTKEKEEQGQGQEKEVGKKRRGDEDQENTGFNKEIESNVVTRYLSYLLGGITVLLGVIGYVATDMIGYDNIMRFIGGLCFAGIGHCSFLKYLGKWVEEDKNRLGKSEGVKK